MSELHTAFGNGAVSGEDLEQFLSTHYSLEEDVEQVELPQVRQRTPEEESEIKEARKKLSRVLDEIDAMTPWAKDAACKGKVELFYEPQDDEGKVTETIQQGRQRRSKAAGLCGSCVVSKHCTTKIKHN